MARNTELHLLTRLYLYTEEEVRKIEQQRENFDNKLLSVESKDNFLQYISFEMDILKDIKERRRRNGTMQNKDSIEGVIGKRIIDLYKTVIYLDDKDYKMWISCIKFCKDSGFNDIVTQLINRLVLVHGSQKSVVWSVAARWDIDCGSAETAKEQLLRGLHFHYGDINLHRELFELYLNEANIHIPKDYTQAKLAYLNSLKCIKDSAFHMSLISIAEGYDFTAGLQNDMVYELIMRHGKEIVIWNFLAQRELRGFHYASNSDDTDDKYRITACMKVYKEAVKLIKDPEIWHYYIEAMSRLDVDPKILDIYEIDSLESVLEEAEKLNYLKEEHYITWHELLSKSDNVDYEALLEMLKRATAKFPRSVELWKDRIHYYISQNDGLMVEQLFTQAIGLLGLDSFPLWHQKLLYHHCRTPPDGVDDEDTSEVEKFYIEACKQSGPISNPFKSLYIEWLCLHKGIVVTRQAYQKIAKYEPYSLELHTKMAYLESISLKLKKLELASSSKEFDMDYTEHLRDVHKLATEQFGTSNTDVWIDYIKFEITVGIPKKATTIYSQAKYMLSQDYHMVLESEFNHISNNGAFQSCVELP